MDGKSKKDRRLERAILVCRWIGNWMGQGSRINRDEFEGVAQQGMDAHMVNEWRGCGGWTGREGNEREKKIS